MNHGYIISVGQLKIHRRVSSVRLFYICLNAAADIIPRHPRFIEQLDSAERHVIFSECGFLIERGKFVSVNNALKLRNIMQLFKHGFRCAVHRFTAVGNGFKVRRVKQLV